MAEHETPPRCFLQRGGVSYAASVDDSAAAHYFMSRHALGPDTMPAIGPDQSVS